MREVSGRILVLDPFARGLGARGRAQRVTQALTIAASRLKRCQMHEVPDGHTVATLSDLNARLQSAGKLRAATLERDPDLSDQVMSLVFEIEALPQDACGDAPSDDRALQLIAEQHQPVS